MRITVIVHSVDHDALSALRDEVRRLRGEGHEVSAHATFEEGDARRFASEAGRSGAELVIAAGGDGTVNEVANGIHGLGDVPAVPRLAIVPLGTGNDLASELGLPQEVGAAVRVAVEGRSAEIDVGTVGDRYFLNVSAGGFGAEATEETPRDAKRALGALAYVITGARKFVALDVSSATFRTESGVVHDGPFLLFAVGNSRRTGGGNRLTPRASLRDGLLDLCIVREMTRMEFVKLLPELRSGEHLGHPCVIYRQAREVTVAGGETLSVNADGEPLSGSTFTYAVSPRRMRVMLPNETP